ncbi:MAG TPA: hypothetical protein VFI91_07305 [Longimicrobiaceae bacterium]|nr:hypothetical protein [Longimicrobiaceae bacterium]
MSGSNRSAAEAWSGVQDGLLSGIGHALNNRAASVSALAQVLSVTHPSDAMGATLGGEAERLEETIALLRLLVRRWESAPEPVQLPETLADVQRLMRHHSGFREIAFTQSVEPGVLPIWTEPSSLLHGLCMVVGCAARGAERSGRAGVRIRCHGNSRVSAVEVTAAGDQDSAGNATLAGANVLIESIGGVLRSECEADERRLQIEFPTLPEVRRMERDALL